MRSTLTCKPRILKTSNCSSKLCQPLYRVPLLVLVPISTQGVWPHGLRVAQEESVRRHLNNSKDRSSRPFNSHVEHRLLMGLRDARSQGNRRDADIPRDWSSRFSWRLSCFCSSMLRIANLFICHFLRRFKNTSVILAAIRVILTFFVLMRCCV